MRLLLPSGRPLALSSLTEALECQHYIYIDNPYGQHRHCSVTLQFEHLISMNGQCWGLMDVCFVQRREMTSNSIYIPTSDLASLLLLVLISHFYL